MNNKLDSFRLATGEFLRKEFPRSYKLYQEICGEVAYEFLSLGPVARALSVRRLRKLEESSLHPFELVKQFKGFGLYRSIAAVQVESEISELFDMVRSTRPNIICELGTDMGGTLYLWSKVIQPDGLIISIDLPRTYRKSLNRFFELAFLEKENKSRICFLREDSQSHECREKVRRILNGKQIDFLFIDADHSYEGVRRDFLFYSPFVRESGVIAFHDILDDCGVDRFWSEIKSDYVSREIVENYGQGFCGIGLLYNKPQTNGTHL